MKRINYPHFMLFSGMNIMLLAGLVSCTGVQTPTLGEASSQTQIQLSKKVTLSAAGGRNPTTAVDPSTGTIYLAWAQDIVDSASTTKKSKKTDPKQQALLVRSDDGGRNFSERVRVSSPQDNVYSHTVSPTQVAVGAKGEVYVLYNRKTADFTLPDGFFRSRTELRLARSVDSGKSFAPAIDLATEAVEGVYGSPEMINLFAAANGDLYASWLDYREMFSYLYTQKKTPPKGRFRDAQLRVARSSDGGHSFAASTLVTKPVCVCCGTKVAQRGDGTLYASTRASWPELKGSVDTVRDIIYGTSTDDGATWSKAVKVHDDRFKVSGCPDVALGFSADSRGRLHVAWYTGTERNPGIYYSVSDENGKNFSKPVPLLSDEWVPYADVKLALDANDNAWVAFEDRRSDIDLIHLVRVSVDGMIKRAEPWPGSIPDVAAHDDVAIVTWGGLEAENGDPDGSIQMLRARLGE